jgi:hypothetical protein
MFFMKKISRFLLLAAFLLPLFARAQAGGNIREQVETIRKNVYNNVLDLTDAEAQKFWPVFDKMQTSIDELHKEARQERARMVRNYNTMSDAEMEKSLDHLLDIEQKILDLHKQYIKEFEKVIPIKKVALIPKAEREFKKQLLEKIKAYKDED